MKIYINRRFCNAHYKRKTILKIHSSRKNYRLPNSRFFINALNIVKEIPIIAFAFYKKRESGKATDEFK